MIKFIIGFVFMALLSGCGGWSKTKCSTSNFEAIGYERGSKGLSNRGDSIYGACLKKEVTIDIQTYNKGYESGLRVFCTDSKGFEAGRLGKELHKVCNATAQYMKAYDRGLKTYCTVKKGTQDGYSMSPEATVCLTYSAYMTGYKNGTKSYCSTEKGQEDGFSGSEMHSKCSTYEAYRNGYKNGTKNYCEPENAIRLGEKGAEIPVRCTSAKFKTAYNKGRKLFVNQRIKELTTYLSYEKRNYENLRDELQDAQFAYQNIPKRGLTPEQQKERRSLSKRIRKLTKERDKQRTVVTDMENELINLRNESNDL